MSNSVNRVILVGRLGKDPEVRSMQNGNKVVNFSLATSESWTDKTSGERREKVEWHKVSVWDEVIAGMAEKQLHKGSMVYLEGSLTTRKYTDQSGADKYVTEVVLNKFRSSLTILDNNSDSEERPVARPSNKARTQGGGQRWDEDLNSDIPF